MKVRLVNDSDTDIRPAYTQYNVIGIIAGLFLVDLVDDIVYDMGEHAIIPHQAVLGFFFALVLLVLVYSAVSSRGLIWQFFGGLNAGMCTKWAGDALLSKGMDSTVSTTFLVLLSISALCILIAWRQKIDLAQRMRDTLRGISTRNLFAGYIFAVSYLYLATHFKQTYVLYTIYGFMKILIFFNTFKSLLYVRYVVTSRLFPAEKYQTPDFYILS